MRVSELQVKREVRNDDSVQERVPGDRRRVISIGKYRMNKNWIKNSEEKRVLTEDSGWIAWDDEGDFWKGIREIWTQTHL